MHRIRHIEAHLFAKTEVMLCPQTGVEDDGRVVQRVDTLLAKLPRRQSFDMNKLIEITLDSVQLFQTRVRRMRSLRTGLRKKNSFYHRKAIILSDK